MTELTQYKVALWPSAIAAQPTFEIDLEAEDAEAAAILALQRYGSPRPTCVVVVLSDMERVSFDDANIAEAENDLLLYSKKETWPRQTDKPFEWHRHEKSHEETEEEIQEMNRDQDERW